MDCIFQGLAKTCKLEQRPQQAKVCVKRRWTLDNQWIRTKSDRMVGVSLNDLAPKFPVLDAKAVVLLKQIGVTDMVSLISLPIERLSSILGLTFHSADQLQKSLIEQYSPAPCSGLAIYQVCFIDQSSWTKLCFNERQHQIHLSSQLAAELLMKYLVEGWDLEKSARLF